MTTQRSLSLPWVAGSLVSLVVACDGSVTEAHPPAVASAAPKIHFEPAQLDHRDMAVGEVLVERVALVSDAPIEWDPLALAEHCDCMTAAFIGTPTPTRAEVDITIHADKVEEIDGMVDYEGPKHELLARFDCPIRSERKPFTSPREILLGKGASPRFTLTVGQAFAPDAKRPDSLLDELDVDALDAANLTLLTMGADEAVTTEAGVLVTIAFEFEIAEAARGKPLETELPIGFGDPPIKRKVRVKWAGK